MPTGIPVSAETAGALFARAGKCPPDGVTGPDRADRARPPPPAWAGGRSGDHRVARPAGPGGSRWEASDAIRSRGSDMADDRSPGDGGLRGNHAGATDRGGSNYMRDTPFGRVGAHATTARQGSRR